MPAKCKLETETGLLVQMRASFFFLFLLQPALVSSFSLLLRGHPSLPLINFVYVAVVVACTCQQLQQQLLLLLTSSGRKLHQMTNFIVLLLPCALLNDDDIKAKAKSNLTSSKRRNIKFLAMTPQLALLILLFILLLLLLFLLILLRLMFYAQKLKATHAR